jgi:hypothetical protein
MTSANTMSATCQSDISVIILHLPFYAWCTFFVQIPIATNINLDEIDDSAFLQAFHLACMAVLRFTRLVTYPSHWISGILPPGT